MSDVLEVPDVLVVMPFKCADVLEVPDVLQVSDVLQAYSSSAVIGKRLGWDLGGWQYKYTLQSVTTFRLSTVNGSCTCATG